jgi:hypothetical protein
MTDQGRLGKGDWTLRVLAVLTVFAIVISVLLELLNSPRGPHLEGRCINNLKLGRCGVQRWVLRRPQVSPFTCSVVGDVARTAANIGSDGCGGIEGNGDSSAPEGRPHRSPGRRPGWRSNHAFVPWMGTSTHPNEAAASGPFRSDNRRHSGETWSRGLARLSRTTNGRGDGGSAVSVSLSPSGAARCSRGRPSTWLRALSKAPPAPRRNGERSRSLPPRTVGSRASLRGLRGTRDAFCLECRSLGHIIVLKGRYIPARGNPAQRAQPRVSPGKAHCRL